MGWLRDYLWLNSSQLINGYNPFGMNSLSVWAWTFLFGHLVYATGFMFLISWRGYWQELIETLVWAHEKTPLANLVYWKDKPVALSIGSLLSGLYLYLCCFLNCIYCRTFWLKNKADKTKAPVPVRGAHGPGPIALTGNAREGVGSRAGGAPSRIRLDP
jgi:hypothetical protein